MSFWSDLSPAVKGVIIVGVLGLLYLGAARAFGLPPWGGVETTQQRGLSQ